MAHLTRCSIFVLASFGMIGTAANAQTFFRTWFDAPETVTGGETFTVDVWAEASGDWVGGGDFASYFNAFLMSIEVSGNMNTFDSISEASINLNFPVSFGTPEGPWLNDVIAFNLFGFGANGTTDNPLQLFSFDVSTVPGEFGQLQLLHHPSSIDPDLLRWYVNPAGPDEFIVGSADDNSVLSTEPWTVRVIPAPGAAALFALAGLGTARRRR